MKTNATIANLWDQILALPVSDRRWLRDKLNVYEEEQELQTSPQPYTLEELNARLDESEADEAAGREYTGEQVKHFLETKYPWLCK